MKGNHTVEEAINMLYEKHIGSVVIVDSEKCCAGIFTERDAIRIIATKIPLNQYLMDVMTRNVITIWEGASFSEAKQLFKAHSIRHIPTVDKKNHLVGILSIRSILDEIVGF